MIRRLRWSGADAVGVAVAALLTAVFVFGLVAPLALRGRLAAARADAAVRQKQRLRAVTATLGAATHDLAAARAELADCPLRLLPATALNRRLADVIALAGECGLTVVDVKPGDAVSGRRCVTVPVRLAGRGGYPDATRFLRQLQQRLPDVHAAAFKLSGEPESATPAGTFVIDLRWRAELPPSGATSVALSAE